MAGFPNLTDQRYLIDRDGHPVGGTISFYLSGTNTFAPVYADAALTTPRANPITVAAGSPVPTVFLDANVSYRRTITFQDGSASYDVDPYNVVNGNAFLPLTGGSITGNLSVSGTLSGSKVTGVSPNSGSAGAVVIKDAPGSPDAAYLQFVNNTGLTEYGNIRGRINGSFSISGPVYFPAGTTTLPSLNVPVGVAPTSPASGDIWNTSTGLFTRIGSISEQILSVAAQSLASPGYIKLNNGLIIQWGVTATYSAEGGQVVTFPVAFPTACLVAVATVDMPSASNVQDLVAQIYSKSTTSLGVYMQYTGSGSAVWGVSADWIAIGY